MKNRRERPECKAHGAQEPECIVEYTRIPSTAQRSSRAAQQVFRGALPDILSMGWTPPPLTTPRLSLVAPTDADQTVFSSEGREALQGLPSHWKICLLSDPPEPIGMIGFLRWERKHHSGEIGFFIRESFRRQQYATEACRAVVAFGFREMALLVVQAKSLPSNVASVRVLEKIGMKKIARLRERLSTKGEEVDLDLYAIDAACGDR